ncbi:putative ATPase [Agrococcus sp. UYP10]|uniref:ATP-binding protein n=1 Tax=Agrococcus sp. UYP10 TaxID=1756355 RepID=UPI00339B9A97
MSDGGRARIRTPDQRLRVFVSSTLRELEAERRAVRSAIEQLRLAPVMFELGARPHPPRDLYRAYLEQSDVFVGIYAERYGWVAPGEDVSGLEDEYRLARPSMPRLIYLREGATREPRLDELIERIQADDTASYKTYRSPDDLAELVEADLATLLAERFDAAVRPAPAPDAPGSAALDLLAARIPSPYTRLIGREREVRDALALLADRGTRLVTLLGPGGIGKSRLAIAVAEAAAQDRDRFPDGAAFVPLENVLEPALLLPAIGAAIGVRDTGELPLEERLAIALRGRRMLFVLDNFEQLVAAAPIVVRLFTIAPDASFLVTSRAVLRVRGERVVEVPPLATHDPASPDSIARARSSPAVELLVERAHAVKPDFEVTDANVEAIVGICRVLEGIPLAIELAAARMRVLTPAGILQRLDHQLPLLVDASRDLPPRQRTLRSTIEWSTGLLTEPERRVLRDLSVFSPGFTLESIEALGEGRGWDADVMAVLETLVDSSLLRQEDMGGEPVFSMLATVREHGVERLREAGDEQAARDAHAAVYLELARREGRGLGFSQQVGAVARLNLERGNLRTAVRHLTSGGDVETAADMAWRLFLYWWVGEFLIEVAMWMDEVVASPPGSVSPRATAIATFYVSWRDMWLAPSHEIPTALLGAAQAFVDSGDELGATMAVATAGLAEINTADPDIAQASAWLQDGARRFRELGAGWGESLALVALGRISVLTGDLEAATADFRRAVEAAVGSGDRFTASVARHHLGRALLLSGSPDDAEPLFLDAVATSVGLRHEEGIAYGIEGLAAIAAARDDVDRAGVLAGAAAAIRARTAVFDAPAFVFHTRYLDELASRGDAERLRAAEQRGRDYGAFEAAEYALTGGMATGS